MRLSSAAIFTLAALAANNLDGQATAATDSTPVSEEEKGESVVVPVLENKSESTKMIPQPENIAVGQFSSVNSEQLSVNSQQLSVNSEQSSVISQKGRYLMDFVEELAKKYRQFYRVGEDDSGNVYYLESSHSILRPISIALDVMLSSPRDTDTNTLINFGSGQIRDALERLKGKEVSKRILRKNKSQELFVIKEFMQFCVEEILGNK